MFHVFQGDVKFAEVLEKMGAKVEWTDHTVTVTGAPVDSTTGKRLKAIDVDMNAMPDVAMTLAVLGLFSDGPVAIRDGTFLHLRKSLVLSHRLPFFHGLLLSF